MAIIDVFNGDADGLCSLVQLRSDQPLESKLVTGVKRDIQLLNNLAFNEGDQITVLDISLEKNILGLNNALQAGADVFYVDHHFSGEIPEHKNLNAIINTAPDVCTSILVNRHLKGKYIEWAIVGAFGDNLKNSALSLAKPLNFTEQEITFLNNLGTYINYNGYGSNIEDLHFDPEDLYREISDYSNPFEFFKHNKATYEKLENGYISDMSSAKKLESVYKNDRVKVFVLPNEGWARRVSGVYSNDLTNQSPDIAHAVLTEKSNGNFLVSVRAPLSNKVGADTLCRSFATGGGRAAAAGINDLPENELDTFIEKFNNFYS